MAGRGGYQPPARPAAVSGPGAMSQRTDGRQPVRDLPNAEYGGASQFRELQQGAPLAASGAPSSGGGAAAGDPLASLVGLGAGTTMPGQPVTAGAALGEGPGLDALGLSQSYEDIENEDAKSISPGQLQAMIAYSMRDEAPASFKRAVRVALANRNM